MSSPVFVSVGRRFKREQHIFVNRVIGELHACGLVPRLVPRSKWDPEMPLRPIQATMRRCHGVIVLAFPRLLYQVGYEWPDSTRQTPILDRFLPTPWLQIEAALGFQLGLPVLI